VFESESTVVCFFFFFFCSLQKLRDLDERLLSHSLAAFTTPNQFYGSFLKYNPSLKESGCLKDLSSQSNHVLVVFLFLFYFLFSLFLSCFAHRPNGTLSVPPSHG
jgi:hypothetical protein